MKTVIEDGVKKYLATYNGPQVFILGESLITGEVYRVFKMKNGTIIVEGYMINDFDKRVKRSLTRTKSQMKDWSYVNEWGVFQMPTKEARIFARKTPVLIADFAKQEDAIEFINAGGLYYDELIEGYEVKRI